MPHFAWAVVVVLAAANNAVCADSAAALPQQNQLGILAPAVSFHYYTSNPSPYLAAACTLEASISRALSVLVHRSVNEESLKPVHHHYQRLWLSSSFSGRVGRRRKLWVPFQ